MENIYKSLLLLVVLVSLSNVGIAQDDGDPISIGEYKTVHSKVLNEDRIVSIRLPKGYASSTQSYPVIYHTYGDRIDQYFAEAASITYNLASDGAIPNVILVGIDERNLRYRDLLPKSDDGSSTGITKFTKYVSSELMPIIERDYRTKDFKIFVGPQVGANFGIYTLFSSPDMFDAFIITNPFRWRGGREFLFERIESFLLNRGSPRKFLFITHDDDDPLEVEGNSYISRLKKILSSANPSGLRVEYNYLEDSYDFVSPTGLKKGLKALFKGYLLPKDVKVETLAELRSYYSALSEKLGFEVDIPDLTMALKSDELVRNSKVDAAEELLKYAESQYPRGINALWRLGNLYRTKGDKVNAIKYYKKVIAILPSMKPAQDYIDELSK